MPTIKNNTSYLFGWSAVQSVVKYNWGGQSTSWLFPDNIFHFRLLEWKKGNEVKYPKTTVSHHILSSQTRGKERRRLSIPLPSTGSRSLDCSIYPDPFIYFDLQVWSQDLLFPHSFHRFSYFWFYPRYGFPVFEEIPFCFNTKWAGLLKQKRWIEACSNTKRFLFVEIPIFKWILPGFAVWVAVRSKLSFTVTEPELLFSCLY